MYEGYYNTKRYYKKSIGKYPKNWQKIKKIIGERDSYICQVCGKKVFYSIPYSIFTSCPIEEFRVHHIDLNRDNTDLSNLIFVCTHCHGKLHRIINAEYKKELTKTHALA